MGNDRSLASLQGLAGGALAGLALSARIGVLQGRG